MTTSEWADFLARQFAGTEYEAKATDYWGWCSAGVRAADDPEEVAEAWIEQRRDRGRPDAQAELERLGGLK